MDFSKTWEILTKELNKWYVHTVEGIPNFILAIVLMLIFVAIAKVVKRLMGRVAIRLTPNRAVVGLFQTLSYFVVILLGLFIALGVLNLEKTVTSLLAGAGVIGLALGFAFQEIASNFVSGILIAFREPYQIGDIVEIDNYFGEVTDITLRTTSVTTFQGLEVLIPNKDMFTKAFINYTTTPKRRLDLSVGVSYGDDLAKVEKVVIDALENIEGRIASEPIQVFYNSFGNSSINFDAHIWIEYPGNQTYLKARHQAIMSIKKAFDDNDITIPFPIRTLDFGIKGGERLIEPLQAVFQHGDGSSPRANQ